MKLMLVVRLLVRCVTGFNKDCPPQLSAGLWQLRKMLIAPIRTQMGAFNLEWRRGNTFNWKGGDWKHIVGFKISIQVFICVHPHNSGTS
jgi:hypothetical protein